MSDSENSTENSTEATKKQRGRPRKHSTDRERIDAFAKKQCEEKRAFTYIKKRLKFENHESQLFLLNLLSTQILDDELMNIVKNIIVSQSPQ